MRDLRRQLQKDRARLRALYVQGAPLSDIEPLRTRIEIGEKVTPPAWRAFAANRVAAVLILLFAAIVVSTLSFTRESQSVVSFSADVAAVRLGSEASVVWNASERSSQPRVLALTGVDALDAGGVASLDLRGLEMRRATADTWSLVEIATDRVELEEVGEAVDLVLPAGGTARIDLGNEPQSYPRAMSVTAPTGDGSISVSSPIASISGRAVRMRLMRGFKLSLPSTSIATVAFDAPRLTQGRLEGVESTIRRASVSFPEYKDRSLTYTDGTTIRLGGFEGMLTIVAASEGETGVALRLLGTVRDVCAGVSSRCHSLKPSRLESLLNNNALAVFWTAFAGLMVRLLLNTMASLPPKLTLRS